MQYLKKQRLLLVAFLLISSQWCFTDVQALKGISSAFTEVATTAMPAVVSIFGTVQEESPERTSNDSYDLFSDEFFRRFFNFHPEQQQYQPSPGNFGQEPALRGSGFVVSPDGYIVTNNHVVRSTNHLTVVFHDGKQLDAELVGADPMADVAVLKVAAKDLPTLKFANSDKVKVGEWAIAIGIPLGLEASLSVGVVSAKGRSGLSITALEDFLQTDAAINPGNSGGPLLTIDGEVVGINTAIATTSGGYMGIGFAIPSNMAKSIINQLIETGTIARGFLGVLYQPVTHELAVSFGLEKTEGALITELLPDSPAEQAGLQQGDIILKFNDHKVKHVGALVSGISMLKPGTTVELQIFRDGKHMTIPVVVGDRPTPGAQEEEMEFELGFNIDNLTDEIKSKFGYKGEEGVIVVKVDRNSTAATKGIRPGTLIVSVNRKPVNSINEFYRAVNALSKAKAKRALFLTKNGNTLRFITLPLNPE